MENFTLNTMVEYAKKKGFKRIVGEYLTTPKNKMVELHYPNLGFAKSEEPSDGVKYVLDVDSYQPRECYITKKEVES
jgi:predicted enzyme involved in methoxymalonyl-ACP biosynthesis